VDTDRRRENQHVDTNGRRESQHVDTKGGAITIFTINCENQDSNSRSWALIPCQVSCTSQRNQKSELMERASIIHLYTSTPPLTCDESREKSSYGQDRNRRNRDRGEHGARGAILSRRLSLRFVDISFVSVFTIMVVVA
jgi:hypothetical protein